MLVPVRCWTCHTPLAHLYKDFITKTTETTSQDSTLLSFQALRIDRLCCRRMLMTQVKSIESTIAPICDQSHPMNTYLTLESECQTISNYDLTTNDEHKHEPKIVDILFEEFVATTPEHKTHIIR